MTEGEEVGHDIGGFFSIAVLDQLGHFAEANKCVGVLPVDFVVGGGRIVAGMEDEVLLQQDGETVLDLPRVQVGGAGNDCERLPAMAGENGVDSLQEC